jgi:RNA polymerase sigma-70 factor (ECF subfamily)
VNQDGSACVHTSVDDEEDDAALLQRVAAGDRAAFGELYARNAPWLALRLRRRCRQPELAAEVLQDVFLVVWRAAGSYAGAGDPAGWLWSIASRRLIDAHRRRAARPVVVGEPLDGAQTAPSAEEVALAPAVEPELARALDGLAPELREVLQVTVLDGLTTREAAVLLGVPEGTVKSRASRARLRLREALS